MVHRQKHRIIKTNVKEEKKEKSSFMRQYDEKLRRLAAADQAQKHDEAEYKRSLVEMEHARTEAGVAPVLRLFCSRLTLVVSSAFPPMDLYHHSSILLQLVIFLFIFGRFEALSLLYIYKYSRYVLGHRSGAVGDKRRAQCD